MGFTQNQQFDETTPYLYVFVRRDLTAAQQAVQSGHALIEASSAFYDPQANEHPHLIILNVGGERSLQRTAEKLERAGISFRAFREPDLNNELTAIACKPVCGEQRRLFIGYPLMGAAAVSAPNA